jgi:hypothetical protein
MNHKKDMAICFVVFNPSQSKRIVMNYFYVKNKLVSQGLPVFTLELVYKDCEPEIPDAFHVSSSSFLFHKENLYRILEKKIPSNYTKLAFLDADIYFSDKEWYTKTSELLNTYDVVQPFERAHWLDLTYKKFLRTKTSIVCDQNSEWNFQYHPGFAWCMRRDFYTKVGFFDYAIGGGGDMLTVAAWLCKILPDRCETLSPPLQKKYIEFQQGPQPRITFLKDIEIYHLFHGTLENRQYNTRHTVLQIEKDIEELIEPNKEGVWEWKDKETWNPLFLTYFKKRDDDGIGYPPNLIHFWRQMKSTS